MEKYIINSIGTICGNTGTFETKNNKNPYRNEKERVIWEISDFDSCENIKCGTKGVLKLISPLCSHRNW